MTSLNDLVTASQNRADRLNSPKPSIAEWYVLVNGSAQELSGKLTSLNEDYNVKRYAFSLPGGNETGNQLQVGMGTGVPDFFQPRKLQLVVQGGGPPPYVTIPKLNSLNERDLYSLPNIVPIYGAIPSRWHLWGNTIEVLPLTVGGAAYNLWYVPLLPKLVDPNQVIDPFWLTINGWDEYIVCDAAAKALFEEESLEQHAVLIQRRDEIWGRIQHEAKPRDISEPGRIVDMKRVRNLWRSGWPLGGGMPHGDGWAGDDDGNW